MSRHRVQEDHDNGKGETTKSARNVWLLRWGDPYAQRVCSATIWASRRTRNPHFFVLGASLLFDNTYFGAFFALDIVFLVFHPFFPIFTYFHSPHVLLSRLISPHYGSPQCGHSATAFVDLHLASDAVVKVKMNMQMTSSQMKINPETKRSSII